MPEEATPPSTLHLVAQIVSAHVSNNTVSHTELPDIIATVHKALAAVVAPPTPVVVAAREPAVNPKKSVFQDHIVCLEDGKKLKMLKRHLRTAYGMTPAQYRVRWGLPESYPMVAPGYAMRRSDLAKEIGLGRKANGHV